MQLNPYLFYPGTCEEAFKFYEKALAAKILALVPNSQAPGGGHKKPGWENKLIHAALKLGDITLMGSDDADMKGKPQGFRVHVGYDTAEEAEKRFAALSEGGTVNAPMMETFFAKRFGMVTDKFGTPWMMTGAMTAK
jgi:PhnB protein